MTIDCGVFAERLDDLLEERLDAGALREAEEHLRMCAPCRELRAAAAGALLDMTIEPPAGLAEAVLRRTSGPPCQSAPDIHDPHDDEGLVRMHLNGCVECAALSRVLAHLKVDLPALAEMEPAPGFLNDVLSRTASSRGRRSTPIAWTPGIVAPAWAGRIAAGMRRLVRRPRFAWEGGYIGALFLILLFGTPGSPLAGIPGEALSLVRTNPIAMVRESANAVTPRLKSRMQSFWQTTSGTVAMASDAITDDLARRSTSVREFRAKVGTLWDRLTSEDETDNTNRPANSDAGQTEGDE